MKGRTIAGGVAVATAGLMALAACGSTSSGASGSTTGSGTGNVAGTTVPGAIGTIPAAAGSQKAGSITWGELTSSGPNYILPNIDSADNSVYNNFTFQYQMWRPLYWVPKGVSPVVDQELSPAEAPQWSNNFTTLSIKLKDWNWSTGQPISSTDLEFTIDQITAALKLSPAGWAPYAGPGSFPDTIKSMSTPDAKTLVINLTKPINPTYLEEDVFGAVQLEPSFAWAKTSANGAIIPSSQWSASLGANKTSEAIYKFLSAQNKSLSTYATNPLWQTVYGPYKISKYDTTSRSYTLVPNTTYGGPHAPEMSSFSGVGFTSETAEWNAVKAGQIDVAFVPSADDPQIPQLKGMGYNYFGIPVFGQNEVFYNFKNKTNSFGVIISQLYVRQALQHLNDQDGVVKGFMHGYGDASYGPVPVYPQNPYVPSDASTNPYPFSVSAATSLLKSHGWTLSNGVQTCTSPGTGASQCGAGIPQGATMTFGMDYYSGSDLTSKEATNLAADFKQAGIVLNLKPVGDFNTLTAQDSDTSAPANTNKWDLLDFGGFSNSTYPSMYGAMNTGGVLNFGDWSDAKADSLMKASVTSSDPNAVSDEASYLSRQLPVMWEALEDYTWAWKTSVQSTKPEALEALTQYSAEPEFWYVTK